MATQTTTAAPVELPRPATPTTTKKKAPPKATAKAKLADIAEKIGTAEGELRKIGKRAIEVSQRIGEYLASAKELIPASPFTWKGWLKENDRFDYTPQHANRLIALHERADEVAKITEEFPGLGTGAMIAALAGKLPGTGGGDEGDGEGDDGEVAKPRLRLKRGEFVEAAKAVHMPAKTRQLVEKMLAKLRIVVVDDEQIDDDEAEEAEGDDAAE